MEAPFRLRKGPGPTCSSMIASSAANRPASTLAAVVRGLSSTIAPGADEAVASTMHDAAVTHFSGDCEEPCVLNRL